MTIQVICSSCHTRFKVSEKYAGKRGPCPKCKNEIQIPSPEDDVVVHAPEGVDTKAGTASRTVFEPITRTEAKVTPLRIMIAAVSVVVVFGIAALLRSPEGEVHWGILTLGAVLLGPPLAAVAYAFLRDDELAPHEGTALYARAAICGAVYALLWLLYAFVPGYIGLDDLQVFHLAFIVPIFFVAGAFTALVALELDFFSSVMHYGLYLVVTVLLCLVMNVQLL